MSTQGIIIINILGLGLIALIVNLLRIQKLYVGYAAIWLVTTVGLLLIVSTPPLLDFITGAVGAVFPVSALTLLAFMFTIIVLIFFSVKLTVLSEQLAELIQALALKDLMVREGELNGTAKVGDTGGSNQTSLDHGH